MPTNARISRFFVIYFIIRAYANDYIPGQCVAVQAADGATGGCWLLYTMRSGTESHETPGLPGYGYTAH